MDTPSNKNSYQQKMLEKEEAESRLKRQEKLRKAGKWLIGIGVLTLVIFFIARWIVSLVPAGVDWSVSYPDLGRPHVPVGTEISYNSNPPTSGPHYSEWALEKFYNKEIPDGYLIHNLEHGDIWISYHPRVSSEIIEKLKKFAGSKVVISARSANDHDIALAAWTRLDAFNIENGILDETRISDFIKRYTNRGPEKVTGTPMSGRDFE